MAYCIQYIKKHSIFRINIRFFSKFTAQKTEDISMITKELQKAYKAPQAELVELGVMSVLCGSQDGVDGSSTEGLDEQDLSGFIW